MSNERKAEARFGAAGSASSLSLAQAACRQAEREGLLGLFPQAALRLEHELNCALARLDECHKFRDSAIRAMTGAGKET